MNTIRYTLTFVIFITLSIFHSCEIIEPPYITEGTNNNPDNEVVVRKFLLEEFTGHLCPNCPSAAETAGILADFYGDRLITISIHAGNLARPTGSTYNYDFRTTEGDDLNAHFNVAGIPVGMVNRTEFEGGRVLPPGSWGPALAVLEDSQPVFSIKLEDPVQNSSSAFSVPVTIQNLGANQDDYYLVLVITENGIISPQRTNDANQPNGVILDYEHNHVLRKAFTGIWGEKIDQNALSSESGFEKIFTITTQDDWVTENCDIIAYIMNAQQEILQVEKTDLVH